MLSRTVRMLYKFMLALLYIFAERQTAVEAAPFPNKLRTLDLSQGILVYMVQRLDFRLGDVMRLVTSNSPSNAMAVYFLLAHRLARYRRQAVTNSIDRLTMPSSSSAATTRVSSRASSRATEREVWFYNFFLTVK